MGNSAIDNARVRITGDEMEAYLSLPLPEAGESYSLNEVIACIRSQRVTEGIDTEVLQRMIDTPVYGREMCVAKGKRVINGQDGKLTYQFNTDINKRPQIREDGSVDYWSIHAVELVNAGQVIAVYTEPTEYEDGLTVTGKKIAARRGKPVPPLQGKGFSRSEDGLSYIADVSGKIELVNGRIRISEVYEIPGDVGLSTGNIDFHGDVVIHGGVAPGAIVKSTGSITVDGVCENCTLEAAKDIILRSGVLGGNKAVIRSGRNIHAKFFEYCRVEAEGYIEAASALDCQMVSYDRIFLAGRKAGIIGGSAYAASGMEMDVLGSPSEVKTTVEVGMSMEMMKEQTEFLNQQKAAMALISKITEGLRQYDELAKERGIDVSGDERRMALLRIRMTKQAECASLQKKIDRLNGIAEGAKNASIRVLHEVNAGTVVCINASILQVKDMHKSVKFVKKQENVVMVSISDELV